MKPAFSAVELLLVAGISAILVAIAVPGFLEAKVRAEVVDMSMTLASCRTALYQYRLDYNQIPEISPTSPHPLTRLVNVGVLQTEPIDRFKVGLQGYGSLYADPFIGYDDLQMPYSKQIYAKILRNSNYTQSSGTNKDYWVLKSIGPDQTDFQDEGLGRGATRPNPMGLMEYDVTNGVFSLGEIIMTQSGQ